MPNKPLIDTRFFDQPGFNELYNAWSDIFSAGDDFKPDEALSAIAGVRDDLIARNIIRTPDMNELERIACRYARTIGEIASAEAAEAFYV